MLGPMFDPDELICIDDYIDSAEVSSRDYSFHYQMDASWPMLRSVSRHSSNAWLVGILSKDSIIFYIF